MAESCEQIQDIDLGDGQILRISRDGLKKLLGEIAGSNEGPKCVTGV
jgi:hypothetical protein